MTNEAEPSPASAPTTKSAPRIIRRKKKGSAAAATSSSGSTSGGNEIPPHIQNNTQLHHIISTTLPKDYDFEIPKTIWRIENSNAQHVALQFPEGLTMYASTIGDILVKFAYRFQPTAAPSSQQPSSSSSAQANVKEEEGKEPSSIRPKAIQSLSILGDVTYGACCIDDLSARALGCDLLVHYGHSCLVPLTCTVIPCLYVFVEIRVDVQHMVDCVHMTFLQEEKERRQKNQGGGSEGGPARIIEACVMGTVQFRSAVIEAAQRLNSDADSSTSSSEGGEIQFQAIVPQAKPLSPGETLGCTAPSGLAQLDFQGAMLSPRERRERKKQAAEAAAAAGAANTNPAGSTTDSIPRERVMLFLADGRFHLEAAMISNPTLRALRYDPYSKTLTEERYETVKMKRLRREAITAVRKSLGISVPLKRGGNSIATSSVQDGDAIANSVLQPQQRSSSSHPPSFANRKTMGIILGTLGRQGNPAILSRLRSLLHSRGIQTIIVLLSEIFPKKLEMLSKPTSSGGSGVCAWVQVACPRLSIDWGHYFCVPVLSPFELYVAFGEVENAALWVAEEEEETGINDDLTDQYPMDFYTKSGGPWTNYYDSNKQRKVLSYGV
jgi:2-(3-amino-3-carboxypropyl)histidine synthase